MTHHRDEQPSHSDWRPSPPGEVARLRDKLQTRRSRRTFLRTAATASGVLATIGCGIGVFFATRTREYDFGGITCTEVRARIPDLMAKKVDMLTMGKIKVHVAACPNCSKLLKEMGGMPM